MKMRNLMVSWSLALAVVALDAVVRLLPSRP